MVQTFVLMPDASVQALVPIPFFIKVPVLDSCLPLSPSSSLLLPLPTHLWLPLLDPDVSIVV
jgi:hypothetical protein